MSVNKVLLIGNLGKDPQVRFTGGGQAVARFPVATSELCNDPEGQNKLLFSLSDAPVPEQERLERLPKKGGRDLRKSVAYRDGQESLQNLA